MTNVQPPATIHKTLKTVILTVLIILLISLVAWHIILPILGITLVITGGLWAIAATTIAVICIATLLFFIFTGIGALILGGGVLLWTIIAIVLFPFLFPILFPVVLLMFVIGYALRRQRK